jgi:hypothetical protein
MHISTEMHRQKMQQQFSVELFPFWKNAVDKSTDLEHVSSSVNASSHGEIRAASPATASKAPPASLCNAKPAPPLLSIFCTRTLLHHLHHICNATPVLPL